MKLNDEKTLNIQYFEYKSNFFLTLLSSSQCWKLFYSSMNMAGNAQSDEPWVQ